MHAILALSILVLSQNANTAPATETAQPPKTGDPAEFKPIATWAILIDFYMNDGGIYMKKWRAPLEEAARAMAKAEGLALLVVPSFRDAASGFDVSMDCKTFNADCARRIAKSLNASQLISVEIRTDKDSQTISCDISTENAMISKGTMSLSERGEAGLEQAKQYLRNLIGEEARKLKESLKPKKAADPWAVTQTKPDNPPETKKVEKSPSPFKKLLWPMVFAGGLATAMGVLMIAAAALAYGSAWAVNVSTAFVMPQEKQRAYYDRREGSGNLISSLMLGTVVGGVIGGVTLLAGLAAAGSAGGIYLVP